MNKRLDEAITRLRELPEDQQQAAADLLSSFLDGDGEEIELTPEQVSEIEAALADDKIATDEEVEAFFAQFRK